MREPAASVSLAPANGVSRGDDASLSLPHSIQRRGDNERPSQFRRGVQRFCRNRGALAGVVVLCLFAIVALAAPLATTYDPEQTRLDQKLLEPSAAHLLGTDHLGRDILARLAYGARFSLLIGFAAVSVGLIIGVPLGTL